MNLIEASYLKKMLMLEQKYTMISSEDFKLVIEAIDDAPTVDAAPVVHGRWIELEPEIGLMECNLCGHKIMRATCNYCPNCGAKMDGGTKEI